MTATKMLNAEIAKYIKSTVTKTFEDSDTHDGMGMSYYITLQYNDTDYGLVYQDYSECNLGVIESPDGGSEAQMLCDQIIEDLDLDEEDEDLQEFVMKCIDLPEYAGKAEEVFEELEKEMEEAEEERLAEEKEAPARTKLTAEIVRVVIKNGRIAVDGFVGMGGAIYQAHQKDGVNILTYDAPGQDLLFASITDAQFDALEEVTEWENFGACSGGDVRIQEAARGWKKKQDIRWLKFSDENEDRIIYYMTDTELYGSRF